MLTSFKVKAVIDALASQYGRIIVKLLAQLSIAISHFAISKRGGNYRRNLVVMIKYNLLTK